MLLEGWTGPIIEEVPNEPAAADGPPDPCGAYERLAAGRGSSSSSVAPPENLVNLNPVQLVESSPADADDDDNDEMMVQIAIQESLEQQLQTDLAMHDLEQLVRQAQALDANVQRNSIAQLNRALHDDL